MLPETAFRSDAEIAAIGNGLAERSLPKDRWTHAAHVAAAFWLAREGRAAQIGELIRAYNESVGTANTDSSGYHETITLASMRAVQHIHAQHTHLPLFQACNKLLASPLGRADWPLTYWSRPVLFSTQARRSWVDPDLQPLPF